MLEQRGERLDRRRAEDRAKREELAQLVLDRGEQRRRDQRGDAQVEEVVGDADRGDRQLALPDLGQPLLDLGARREAARVLRARSRRGSGSALRSTLPFGVSGNSAARSRSTGTM